MGLWNTLYHFQDTMKFRRHLILTQYLSGGHSIVIVVYVVQLYTRII